MAWEGIDMGPEKPDSTFGVTRHTSSRISAGIQRSASWSVPHPKMKKKKKKHINIFADICMCA